MNYIYNMTRRIGLALVACMLPLAMFSQSGPELLRVNPDARSAAMGDASLGRAERMYIYTNPSAIFPTDCRLDVNGAQPSGWPERWVAAMLCLRASAMWEV